MKTPKINKAFKELNKLGIVAKKNWTCCTTCGHYELKNIKNYVFYHWQDNDNLKESGQCNLRHKLEEKNKSLVLNILNKNGLKAVWNYSNNRTIEITERSI